ncbi:MAG: hypothetical protein ACTS85_00095 [Arsenophonus sp. NC-PG7-MAG3]
MGIQSTEDIKAEQTFVDDHVHSNVKMTVNLPVSRYKREGTLLMNTMTVLSTADWQPRTVRVMGTGQ